MLEWPYVEGLRIDEAMHPLTILAVGLYGQVLPNQNGAPLRLVVPWKYGFKGIKSIVEIRFTEKQPPTSWNISAPHEYGFYANVNPAVDHPRWSQAKERRIGAGVFAPRQPTLPFNGYAEQVAGLYRGMDLRQELLVATVAAPIRSHRQSDPLQCVALKPLLFVLCALPLAWLLARAFGIAGASLGPNPIDEIMDRLGSNGACDCCWSR